MDGPFIHAMQDRSSVAFLQVNLLVAPTPWWRLIFGKLCFLAHPRGGAATGDTAEGGDLAGVARGYGWRAHRNS